MKRIIFVILIFVLAYLILSPDIAIAWHWWRSQHYRHWSYVPPHRAKYIVYVSTLDLNHDGVIDIRDRLFWITKHYVSTGAVSITIVEEERNLICELDLNKDGVIDSGEMQYWITKYDINKNGILEEYEINLALRL